MSAQLCRTEKLLLLSPLRPVRALSTIVSPNGLARAAIQPGRSAFIRPFSLARSGESGQGSEKVWNFGSPPGQMRGLLLVKRRSRVGRDVKKSHV